MNSRKYKGKSLFIFPEDYTVVDIETTGLSSDLCEIIEISAIRYTKLQPTATCSTLLRPVRPISGFITRLTGITNAMVADAPPVEEAILDFYLFAEQDILMGYNVNFDINFLYDNLLRYHGILLTNSFVDILRMSRKALPSLPNHKQTTVAAYYGISTENAHRASVDCQICNACYQKLRKQF